jgi:hypothetical protein
MESHWLTRPRTIRRLWAGFIITLAGTVAVEYLVDRHPHFTLDQVPAFHGAYGLLACAGLILVAKLIALPLRRPDTYYGDDQDE